MKDSLLINWTLFEDAINKIKEYHEHLIWSHEKEVEEQREVGELIKKMEEATDGLYNKEFQD